MGHPRGPEIVLDLIGQILAVAEGHAAHQGTSITGEAIHHLIPCRFPQGNDRSIQRQAVRLLHRYPLASPSRERGPEILPFGLKAVARLPIQRILQPGKLNLSLQDVECLRVQFRIHQGDHTASLRQNSGTRQAGDSGVLYHLYLTDIHCPPVLGQLRNLQAHPRGASLQRHRRTVAEYLKAAVQGKGGRCRQQRRQKTLSARPAHSECRTDGQQNEKAQPTHHRHGDGSVQAQQRRRHQSRGKGKPYGRKRPGHTRQPP